MTNLAWRGRLLGALAAVWVAAAAAGCGSRAGLRAPPEAHDGGAALDGGATRPGDGGASPTDGGPDAAARSDVGEPCAAAEQCAAAPDLAGTGLPACLRGGTWPNGLAWSGGYCTDFCAPPPPIADGVALGQGDCPAGALCVPLEDARGLCLRACEADGDCRVDDGYFCRRGWGGVSDTPATPNGACMPGHCRSRGCTGSAMCAC